MVTYIMWKVLSSLALPVRYTFTLSITFPDLHYQTRRGEESHTSTRETHSFISMVTYIMWKVLSSLALPVRYTFTLSITFPDLHYQTRRGEESHTSTRETHSFISLAGSTLVGTVETSTGRQTKQIAQFTFQNISLIAGSYWH